MAPGLLSLKKTSADRYSSLTSIRPFTIRVVYSRLSNARFSSAPTGIFDRFFFNIGLNDDRVVKKEVVHHSREDS